MRSGKPSVFLRLLLLFLAYCAILSPAAADDHAPSEPHVLKQRVLADFEQLDLVSIEKSWRILADGHPSDAIRFGLETIQRDGKTTQALRLDYRMPPDTRPNLQEHGIEAILQLDGLDASDYDHVSFLIKGVESAGFDRQAEAGFRRHHLGTPGMEEVGRVRISDIHSEWQQVIIPLKQMIGIKDWTSITDFHIALASKDTRVTQGTYLIDDIALIKTGSSGPSAQDPVAAPQKEAWEQARGGGLAARKALKERLAGWPGQPLVDAKTLPAEETAFLRRLALDTWRGIDAFTDREHGLPLDRVHFAEGSVAIEDAFVGDYTSVTNVGFHFLAVAAAYELELISREDALTRLRETLNSLDRMESHQGFFYNYYNTTTLERTSNFISFVDSSWLTAGLMTARAAFPELAERCGRLIAQGNYRFFYDDNWKLMSHGFYVHLGQRAAYHYGALFSEARLGSLIAIGKGDAPEEHWFAMARTFPNEYTWQSRQPLDRREKSGRGFRWLGGYYQWRELRYVPSWGGSLFEALMPALLLDEQQYAPQSLGRNDLVHTEIQRLHALEDLGYPVWGMSPSSTPGVDTYDEYGVHFLGSLGYREGVVTPHAAALALLTEPETARLNLKRLAERYPLYGDFGFYDAVEPKEGRVAYKYLCLNQAMMLVALANHLADHAVQKHFASDPIIQRVLPLIGFENFFD